MKIHVAIVCVFLTALIGVGAWAGNAIIELKTEVAAIRVQLVSISKSQQLANAKQ
jgi:hypothetical protein